MAKERHKDRTDQEGRHAPSSVPIPTPTDQPGFKCRLPRWWATAVCALMAAVFIMLAISSLLQDSVTVDEFGHLPVGFNLLTTGDFNYSELNPPLMNILSALPLTAIDMSPLHTAESIDATSRYSFWLNGYSFMARYKDNYHRIFTAARLVTVLLVTLLGLLLFLWGRILVPSRPDLAGLLAAGFVWFSPGIIAHARLVTTDAGVAFFTTLALFSFHMFLRRPQARSMVATGIAVGMAQLVKLSYKIHYPGFVGNADQGPFYFHDRFKTA